MAPAPRCAYCRERSVDPEYRPFCSKRCKMADLGRWLSGDYRVPGAPSLTDAPGEESEDADADIADRDYKPIR